MANLDDITGMLVPIATPFDTDGELDEPLLQTMVEYYIERGANALVVFGSYGQGPAMSTEQRKRGLELVLSAARDRLPVVPDIGTVDPYRARELAVHANELGVVAIAMVAPYYYNDRRPDELEMHFRLVNEVIELPMMLINNPSYQGYRITTEMVASLRTVVPTLFGVHPAHVSLPEIARYKRDLGEDFRVFASPDTMFPGMLVGQTGVMSPPLSLSVETGVALLGAIERREFDEALRLQLAILHYLRRLDSVRQWFRGTQLEALRHIGFPVKLFPRVPASPLPAGAAREVREAIDELRAATARPSGASRVVRA